jgi:hypothetical protein
MTIQYLTAAFNAAPVVQSVQIPTPTQPQSADQSRRDTLTPPPAPAAPAPKNA